MQTGCAHTAGKGTLENTVEPRRTQELSWSTTHTDLALELGFFCFLKNRLPFSAFPCPSWRLHPLPEPSSHKNNLKEAPLTDGCLWFCQKLAVKFCHKRIFFKIKTGVEI